MNTKRIILGMVLILGLIGLIERPAEALIAPHNASRNVGCSKCHTPSTKFMTITSSNAMCMRSTGCHNVLAPNSSFGAPKKIISPNDISNRFNSLPVSGTKQSSHGWKIPNVNASAGATNWGIVQPYAVLNSKIYCSKCHKAHGTSYPKFLRYPSKGDIICLQCHTQRRVTSARDALPAGMQYSHPVEVNYTAVSHSKTDYFFKNPTSYYPANASARMRLFTAFQDDGVTVKANKAVICSTCHGPLHSSDSNPATFDNISAYSRLGQYSSSAGNLLRVYPPSVSNNICISCHKVYTHQSYMCGDCHEPHKKSDDKNKYLIKRIIAAPYGNHSVFFISTTAMAQRYGIYSMFGGTFTKRSTAVCQVCHRNNSKKRHYAYSTAGATRDHEYDGGTGKYTNCVRCHPHNNSIGGFKLGGEAACGACHYAPPHDTDGGRHFKHIGLSGGSNYDWSTGDMLDQRNAGRYGFSCGRCHSPWAPYTSSNVVPRHRPADYIGDSTIRGYTTEVGFAIKAGQPLPTNPDALAAGSYNYGSPRGASDDGAAAGGSRYSLPASGATDGRCSNLYCHGQFYGGYTSNNPRWMVVDQACGKCHGATPGSVPGKNGTNTSGWGAHQRHVGNANTQEYGYLDPNQNFRCNACHSRTASFNNSTTLDRRYHVNGRVDIEFDASYESQNAAATNYGGFNPYTTRTNLVLTSKTQFKTCAYIYCHSDGSRTQGNYSTSLGSLAIKFPNWSSSRNFTSFGGSVTTKKRCSRCHSAERVAGVAGTSFNGITAAMPGYATRTGKGNSHRKHVIDNGFMCGACHDATVNADNRSIKDTTKHVNRYYDVVMATKYSGSYDNSTKRCTSVKCHGSRMTAVWGDAGRCQDCHFKNTAEVPADEGYADNYAWKSMTSTSSVPRIYSSEWVKFGHGRSAGTYPSSGNAPANKGCSFSDGGCHKPSGTAVSHQSAVSGNTFRLYTGYGSNRIDYLCEECHKTGGSRTGEASKKVMGHNAASMAGWGNANWAFLPKCIDCHDPHGDNNRYMIQKFVNFTGSDTSGKIANSNYARQVTFSTIGGQMNWSSFVKSDFTGICQRCHNTQTNMEHFNKAAGTSQQGYDTGHNSKNLCTGCHKHDAGFKGMDCNGCHKFPPVLSGKHSFHVATTVGSNYVGYEIRSTKTKYAYECGKCHNSGTHYVGTSGNYTTEVNFSDSVPMSYPGNSGATYIFGAVSSFDEGNDGPSGYRWTSTKGQCQNLYCHGKFAGGNNANPLWYGASVCGDCHGASQASAPSGGAHGKHVNVMGYDCRNCHDDTVDAGVNTPNLKNKAIHVDGKTQFKLYTAWSARIGGYARYNNLVFGQATTEISGPTYGFCANFYCHSRGTSTLNPYTSKAAYPNYTAQWGKTATQLAGAGKGCSICHGNKTWQGLTSAMPNQNNQAHKKHVVDNNLACRACHDRTVKAYATLSSVNFHVNKVRDVVFAKAYSGNYSSGSKTCSNVKCHGLRTTPSWTTTGINCKDCHYSNSADVMKYTFSGYSESVATIYSSEWAESGHGRTSGNYRVTTKAGANKNCGNCHVSSRNHNDSSNFFRLTGLGGQTDPSSICKRCHGTSGERQSGFGGGFGTTTGIKGHTQQIMSTEGYANLTTWRFKPKCTDCHDPHGDARATSGNIAMIRNTVLFNRSGSDASGRPIGFPNLSTVMFAKYAGTTSFDNNDGTKGRVCAVCHKRAAHNGNGTGHSNAGLDCRTCHKHKQGFTPAGCTGCHGSDTKLYERSNASPPKGPTTPFWSDSMTNLSSLHLPHAYNPKGRPGFVNRTGFACQYCHDDSYPAVNHNSSKSFANMNNLTSQTGWNGRTKMSKIVLVNAKAPAGDTCSNTACHTPRYYIRKWQKPADCDDCHGYTRGRGTSGTTGRQFNLQTSGSHKIHINWTANAPASWKKNYKFACNNCHYNVSTNNYSTHYNGFVNITANGLVNTVGGQFYSRTRSFNGFTTGNDLAGTTCTKVYCHGNFGSGTTVVKPSWKRGATTMNCGSCHKAKTAANGWSNGTQMPAPHPTHVNSATYNFTCARCHVWTVTNNTTVQFTYSTHVNTRKDVNFDNTSGGFTSTTKHMCQNNYCHSSGATVVPRTVSNYTADWLDGAAANKTGAGKGCSYCHGSKGNGFGGITAAMPNYANQAHAKHVRNATGDSFRCFVCHASTVNAAGLIISNTNHVNKFKNISIVSAYKSGQTGYSTTVSQKKTCKNIKCHGGRITPLWTLTTGINCMDCHKSTTGDTNKRVSAYNGFQSFSGAANSVPKIYSTQWADKGHGRTSGAFPVSGNTISGSKVCIDCHGGGETRAGSLSTRHGNTANNPFRLITAPSRPNTVCDRCHGVAGTGANKKGILTHASSVTGQGHNYEIKCIDCHDPHGDSNAYMVHSTVVRPPDATAAKDYASDSFGRRYGNITGLKKVDFTAKNFTSDYAKKTQAARICQVCHNETQKPRSSTVTRFRWDGSSDSNHGTDKCTGCHSHSSGFKGIACDGCHGMPPVSAATLIGGASNPGDPQSGSNTAGAHQKHVNIWGNSGDTCSKCHYSGMWSSGAKDDDINMAFRAFNVYTGGGQDFNTGTGARTGFYGVSGVGAGAGTDNRCVNMKCHGGGWLTSNINNYSAPLWSDTAKIKCGNCHGAKKESGKGSWPTTNAHAKHAGTGTGQLDYMCKLCHTNTVLGTATTLAYPAPHVNGLAEADLNTADVMVGSAATYDGDTVVNSGFGKCKNTYCHSKGTDMVTPFDEANAFANMTARWSDTRGNGSYKQANGVKAKCNYCHGNSMSGITSAMPNYTDGTPKANKHFKHVRTYNFLCNACHVDVAKNNTAITSTSLHVNKLYDINYTTVRGIVNNSAGNYNAGRCENLYCHSMGNTVSSTLPNYTAKWSDGTVGYKTGANQRSKCNYCHGNKGAGSYAGITSAMPNYANTSPKANRHQKHVVTYGLACKRCHLSVTANNTSIDAADGINLHVNRKYNVAFDSSANIDNTFATYTFQSASPNSKCKNTYCHSRGTDQTAQFNTRTSFANFTARWGDTLNGYKQAAGLKARCNYCHGNRTYSGSTSAMPNYSTQIKKNSHKRHVVSYGFTCKACHKYVTNNNSSIDSAGGTGRHVNRQYDVDFSNAFNNNTGSYTFIALNSLNRCKNTYCHSKGTDFTKPYGTRTSFSIFTAMWGDSLPSYKQAKGVKAKCNYCHGNRAYSGTTSAMPNYSGVYGFATNKANSHGKHVIANGFACSVCHYGVARNNTSISDAGRHVNGFYNISIAPGYRQNAGKIYSSVWGAANSQGAGGGTCKNVKCHGGNPVKWGAAQVGCRNCHFSNTADNNKYGSYSAFRGAAPMIYSSEWGTSGHAGNSTRSAGKSVNCSDCHSGRSGNIVSHGAANNPYRIYTSSPDALCLNCHGTARGGLFAPIIQNYTGYQTHSKAVMSGTKSWGQFQGQAAKCVDCHDPHGDKSNRMIHSLINYTGSDAYGRPSVPPSWSAAAVDPAKVAQMNFTTYGGVSNWSSFANSNKSGICQRCHPSEVNHMSKSQYEGTHQATHQKCSACHKHKSGFKASCTSCHGYPPPNGVSLPSWSDSLTNRSSLHLPHANNPRSRAGFPNTTGFACQYCHDDTLPAGNHDSSKSYANLNNMTSQSGWNGRTKMSRFFAGPAKAPAGDTCSDTKCHTPRSYTRSWKKPTKCDDCHGWRQMGATVYKTHTTQSHKIHVAYTGVAGYRKKYGFVCSNCHYDPANNYSTHYNGFVNITAGGPDNKIGQGFYARTRLFKGFTTGGELTANTTQCTNTYCHGNFVGGLNATPSWKKGVTAIRCDSCHKGAYVNATAMYGKHPKHVSTTKGGYSFACVRCHSWTTNNVTTVQFTYSTHVNGRKDVNFNSQPVAQPLGVYPDASVSKRCENIYCHSKGTALASPFTGAAYSNFTAKWGDSFSGYSVAPTGTKARCNYCHGNKAYTGRRSAMPNYANGAKANAHQRHVVTYVFGCSDCHKNVTANNTSIDTVNGRTLHVNNVYDVNFGVARTFINNSGNYKYQSGTVGGSCKNTYCHSKGTDFTKPYGTRTSFSIFTAQWGDAASTGLSYKLAKGVKARCNYCHGNRAYSGTTSAMPNYSTITVKANSHYKHVISNGFVCSVCHYGVARNNTSIADTGRHVNGFYNISIAPGYRSQAGKIYSSVWGGVNVQGTGGGTCNRVSCHGGNPVKWGQVLSCRNCHFSNAADKNKYGSFSSFKGSAALIYSSEYMNTGHGRTTAMGTYPRTGSPAANRNCGDCHSSNVAHGNANNPFRLYTANPDVFCKGCHGNATDRGKSWTVLPNTTGYQSHSKAGLQAAGYTVTDAAWNFPTTSVAAAKCVDCHDPHGDRNRAMIHTLINYSGSDYFGKPAAGAPYQPAGPQMVYSAFGGVQLNWSSYARMTNDPAGLGICQRCHSNEPLMDNFNKGLYNGAHRTHQECTNCHKHKSSFAPIESAGGQDCRTCHSDFFTPMNSGKSSYHHVMQNASALAGASKYPTGNNYTTTNEPRRRCLQCHVDHDIFRPDINGSSKGRAGNLRTNINTTPTASSGFDRSDYSGTDASGGICISCHTRAQRKSNTQIDDPSVFTLRLFTGLYRQSPHNYNVTTFQINKDNSNFKANCLKCHNDTSAKTKWNNQTGFALHDSKLRRINAQLGLTIASGTSTVLGSISTIVDSNATWTVSQFNGRGVTITTPGYVQTRSVKRTLVTGTRRIVVTPNFTAAPPAGRTYVVGDPPEEDFCYNCHSIVGNPKSNGGVNPKDYFGAVDFINAKATKMEQTFDGDYGTATANSNTSRVCDTTKTSTWTKNKWLGFTVKITAGSGVNQERKVLSNTTGTLVVTPAFTTAPTTKSSYAVGNPFRHRIDQFSGQHLSDEALRAPGGLTTFGWFTAIGTKLHVGCSDCHNPHSQQKPGAAQGVTISSNTYNTITTLQDANTVGGTKSWAPNQWRGFILQVASRNNAGDERMIISNTTDKLSVGAAFSARMTGIYYVILPRGRAEVAPRYDGNSLNGPNNGQWGVKASRWTKARPTATAGSLLDNISTPVFSKVTTLRSMAYPTPNKVYELCFKCHSQYGWGTSGKAFRIMDGGFNALGTYSSGRSRDIAAAVNPNNLAHHALVAVGNNQPIRENYTGVPGFRSITSYYSTGGGTTYMAWPKWSPAGATSTLRIDTAGKARVSASTGGLPNTVIPGWYVYVGGNNPPARAPGIAGAARKGWFQIKDITNYTSFQVNTPPGVAVNNVTSFAISAGLGNAFVPPYGPWSVISCADCHDTDGASDPSGPHGSGRNWLLRKMEKQQFAWMNSSGFVRTIGWGVDTGWTGPYAANTLCLNCHRADVYGNEGLTATEQTPTSGIAAPSGADFPGFKWRGKMSRQSHNPAVDGGNDEFSGAVNTFRIACMNCHAGSGSGQIHGTNRGKGSAGTSYQGKRFLTGGAWDGVTRATTSTPLTCVEGPNAALSAAINNCGGSGTVLTTQYANYDYDGGAD